MRFLAWLGGNRTLYACTYRQAVVEVVGGGTAAAVRLSGVEAAWRWDACRGWSGVGTGPRGGRADYRMEAGSSAGLRRRQWREWQGTAALGEESGGIVGTGFGSGRPAGTRSSAGIISFLCLGIGTHREPTPPRPPLPNVNNCGGALPPAMAAAVSSRASADRRVRAHCSCLAVDVRGEDAGPAREATVLVVRLALEVTAAARPWWRRL